MTNEGKKDLTTVIGRPSMGELLFGKEAKKNWSNITDESQDFVLGKKIIDRWKKVNQSYGFPKYKKEEEGVSRSY